jgi:hypothetical protein
MIDDFLPYAVLWKGDNEEGDANFYRISTFTPAQILTLNDTQHWNRLPPNHMVLEGELLVIMKREPLMIHPVQWSNN